MEEETKQPKRDILLPVSIIIAAVLISVSVIYSAGRKAGGNATANLGGAVNNNPPPAAPSIDGIRPVSGDDHILGDPNAPVKIVEFSDLECPFCKRFHPVMQRVVREYDGKVAWVYRHFPLDSLHSKARKEAEATECANELGGNSKFWEYTDRIFELTPSNNRLDLALLPQIAEDVGLDRAKFESCLNSGKYAEHIAADLRDAQASGGRGTPYSVVIAKNGAKYPIPGALPYEDVKAIIEQALSN